MKTYQAKYITKDGSHEYRTYKCIDMAQALKITRKQTKANGYLGCTLVEEY